MVRVSIDPAGLRAAGLTTVHAADDLQAQSIALRSVVLPEMPPVMAAQHSAALGAVAARLANAVQALSKLGGELQLAAEAAEAADAGAALSAPGAGASLATSVITTSVLLAGGVQQVATVAVSSGGVTAVAGAGGLRVTIPELVRGADGTTLTTAAAEPPDPHDVVQREPASAREVEPARADGGAPAAAVQQAVAAPAGPEAASGGLAAGASSDGVELGSTITAGDQVDPSATAGVHVAGDQPQGMPVPTDMPEDHDASRQSWACWMAGSAAHDGVPPTLPVMLALAGSGGRNLDAGADRVGLFGIDARRSYAPPGHGLPSDAQPDPSWWVEHPAAQLDEVMSRLRGAGGGIRDTGLDDSGALARWATEALPGVDGDALAGAHEAASALVANCKHEQLAGAGGGGGASGGALQVARSQLGVHEVGTNAGPEVNQYLQSAKVGSGNPWCASFVTWSLQQSGHEMPGTGWAAVTNWVQAAEQGQHGLQIVDAAHARPGDIVAYDWGHGGDFGADGHIGFLDSPVDQGGNFVAVEGNAEDAVTRMQRNLGQANVVFIRAGAAA